MTLDFNFFADHSACFSCVGGTVSRQRIGMSSRLPLRTPPRRPYDEELLDRWLEADLERIKEETVRIKEETVVLRLKADYLRKKLKE